MSEIKDSLGRRIPHLELELQLPHPLVRFNKRRAVERPELLDLGPQLLRLGGGPPDLEIGLVPCPLEPVLQQLDLAVDAPALQQQQESRGCRWWPCAERRSETTWQHKYFSSRCSCKGQGSPVASPVLLPEILHLLVRLHQLLRKVDPLAVALPSPGSVMLLNGGMQRQFGEQHGVAARKAADSQCSVKAASIGHSIQTLPEAARWSGRQGWRPSYCRWRPSQAHSP